jgi:hypothetical protein
MCYFATCYPNQLMEYKFNFFRYFVRYSVFLCVCKHTQKTYIHSYGQYLHQKPVLGFRMPITSPSFRWNQSDLVSVVSPTLCQDTPSVTETLVCVCVCKHTHTKHTYTHMASIYIKSQFWGLGCLLLLRLLGEIKAIWPLLCLQHNARTYHRLLERCQAD